MPVVSTAQSFKYKCFWWIKINIFLNESPPRKEKKSKWQNELKKKTICVSQIDQNSKIISTDATWNRKIIVALWEPTLFRINIYAFQSNHSHNLYTQIYIYLIWYKCKWYDVYVCVFAFIYKSSSMHKCGYAFE